MMDQDYDPTEELAVVDEAYAEPLWYRYAVMKDPVNNHDKYYEVSVDLSDTGRFILTRRYGRRPDTFRGGSRMDEDYFTLSQAQGAANDLFAAKLAKGYREVPRPTPL